MNTEKKIYSYDELKEILRLHAMWLRCEEGGKRADLRDSNLRDSDLRGSNLRDSDLSGSDLRGSNLRDSDLRGSNLRDSDLRGSNLSGSDLRGSDLRGSNLSGSDLSDSNLSGSNLRGSNLREIKNDFIASILKLPNEIDFLRQTLIDGKIDGSTYEGECACLAGTMAHACKLDWPDFRQKEPMPIDSCSPRERWFLAIKPGDTPENSAVAKITLEWIDEAIAMRDRIRSVTLFPAINNPATM